MYILGICLNFLLAASFVYAVVHSSLDFCSVKIESIGCFKDDSKDKALKEKIFSRTTDTEQIDKAHWQANLPEFICRCAELAFKKGYKVIGMQAYGDCFSGENSHLIYKKYGSSNLCVGQASIDSKCNDGDTVCSGVVNSNYIYKIAPTDCSIHYEPEGCYMDKGRVPRPLPLLALSERDYTSLRWNGYLIDWRNWNDYIPQLVCRCARWAKKFGYKRFGLQYYGECWVGSESNLYMKDGKSDKCVSDDFKKCKENAYHCIGKDHANSVYILKEGPNVTSLNSTDII